MSTVVDGKRVFNGPIFIVGLSRSGTKLLRDLITQHPKIRMPPVETQFIPHFVEKYGNPPQFLNGFRGFYAQLLKTPFCWRMMKLGKVLSYEDETFEKLDIFPILRF